MNTGRAVIVVGVFFCFACGAANDGGGETTPPPQPSTEPAGPPVSILELLPPAANGGALLQVTRLRASTHGPALTNMVRRIGMYDWEQAVGIDLRTEVEQAILFGIADEAQGPGDLSSVLGTLRASSLGAVVELRGDAVEGDGVCRAPMLEGLQGRILSEPAAGMEAFQCGRFLIVRRLDFAGPLGPYRDSPLAQAIRDVLGDDEALPEDMVFLTTAGPEMVDRVSCDAGTVSLDGWQRATISLGSGMRLGGLYHAAPDQDVERLQQCVSDGMGGFSTVPLFAQLELQDVLENATIAPVADQPRAVSLDVGFSESEMDLLMGILELVGSGMQD